MDRTSANRWNWDEEEETKKTNGLITPRAIASNSNVSIDTFVPDPRNKKSFRHLVDVYPETNPKESFTNLREGIRKNSYQRSFLADTSSDATVVEAEANPQDSTEKAETVSIPQEPGEPDEIDDLISDISRMLRRDTDTAPTPPVQDWLEGVPDPVPESWTESPTNLKRRHEEPVSSESQPSMHERPIRPSPSKVRRMNRQNELCPLCSNPIGDPKDQHVVKCQFAHDERAREEAAKQAALERGQKWG